MIIQLYVIGIITNLVFAYGGEDSLRTFSKVGGKYLASKLNPRIIQNREGLKKIIRALNEHFDDESDVREDDVVNQLNNRDDEVEVENQVGQIKKILGLLQKNYNSQTRYSKLLEKAQPRIYYIENPEIIKQFQTQLRSKGKSTSSSSEITDFDRSFKDDDSSNYRREAIFERFNLASSENIHAPRNDPIDIDDRPNRFSGLSIESGPRNRDDRTQPKVSDSSDE